MMDRTLNFKRSKTLNIKKTNYMLFGYKKLTLDNNDNVSDMNLKNDDQVISEINQTKFLGITINPKFTRFHLITYISTKKNLSLYFSVD